MSVAGISATKPKTRAFVTERTWAYQTKSAFSDTGRLAPGRAIRNGQQPTSRMHNERRVRAGRAMPVTGSPGALAVHACAPAWPCNVGFHLLVCRGDLDGAALCPVDTATPSRGHDASSLHRWRERVARLSRRCRGAGASMSPCRRASCGASEGRRSQPAFRVNFVNFAIVEASPRQPGSVASWHSGPPDPGSGTRAFPSCRAPLKPCR
jgi:hypothetical protein